MVDDYGKADLLDQGKTDLEIVEEVKEGHRRAFSELVKRHQKGLLRLALRFVKNKDTAEDVVQEAFIKAFEKIHSFAAKASFKSWLYQIAVNTAKNKIREHRMELSDIAHLPLSVGASAERGLLDRAMSEILQEEVERLPMRQRLALVLRIYEDLSFKEIAQVMECPYDTAKANYRHALMKLRHSFEDRSELQEWVQRHDGAEWTAPSRITAEVDT
jgi:RNA polymerase sigma-70 factor (ECF subfamily)